MATTQAAVEAWQRQAPDGFTFAVKFGQFGSHRKKLRDAREWLPNHLDRAERLGAHLGPTLVQLPPRWRRDVGRLDEFLTIAPKTMRWAVEVRDPSWLHNDVFDVLRKHGAANQRLRRLRGAGRRGVEADGPLDHRSRNVAEQLK